VKTESHAEIERSLNLKSK